MALDPSPSPALPHPPLRLSRRASWGIYISSLVLLATIWAYRWDSIETPDGANIPGHAVTDVALPDSVASLFGAPASGTPSHRATRPFAAATAPTPSAEAQAPPSPAAPSDEMRRAAMFRDDLRAFALDVYNTGWVGPNRAKYLAYAAVSEAYRQGIPPALVLGVMLVENDRFASHAVSSAGAMGLLQVMPFWTSTFGSLYGRDLTDDLTNIRYGVHILAINVREAGLSRGLLRYNGCVSGSRTADCFLYPYKVRRRVERYARWTCPSRDFHYCVMTRLPE